MPSQGGPPASADASGQTCLVTGATGAIGPTLVRALGAAGHAVRVLARSSPPAGLLPSGVEVVTGELTDAAAVAAAMTRIRWVFHLAAKLHIVNPPPVIHAEYHRVNVEGTRTIVEAAGRAAVERVVFFSTISVYGPSRGGVLSELSPLRPETIYGVTKQAAERVVLDAMTSGQQRIGTVLRLAAVYGPRVKGNYRRLLDAMARGRFVPIGSGANRRTLVFEDDVVRAALLAASHPAAAGEAFNVTDGGLPALRDIIRAIAAALGRTPPRYSLPAAPTRALARVVDRVAHTLGRSSVAIGPALDKYLEDVAVDGRRLRERLGFTPSVALDDGWRRTVEQLRARGEL